MLAVKNWTNRSDFYLVQFQGRKSGAGRALCPSSPPHGGSGGGGTYTIIVNWQKKNRTDSWLEGGDKATCMGESGGETWAPLLLPREFPLWPKWRLGCPQRHSWECHVFLLPGFCVLCSGAECRKGDKLFLHQSCSRPPAEEIWWEGWSVISSRSWSTALLASSWHISAQYCVS